MDEAGEQFVAYFLPTDETMAKRRSDQDEGRDYTDDAEYEYKMARCNFFGFLSQVLKSL